MLAKRFISFFQYDGSDSAELSLPSFEKILLDCTVTAVTSAHIKKKNLPKLVHFLCRHLNIEDGKNKYTFSAYYALLFQER